MAKRLTYTKRNYPNQIIQIGDDDDAATPLWRIRKQTRERIVQQRPDLSPAEVERKVQSIVSRGMRPTASSIHR